YVAVTTGTSAASILSPAIIATGLGLIGTFASVAGNEAAIRFGRKRLVMSAMLASILIGGIIGFVGPMSYAIAAVLITLYGIVIWLDSSSPTAGTAGTAEPSRRHAGRAFHARLRGWLRRPAAGRLDPRPLGRDVANRVGHVVPRGSSLNGHCPRHVLADSPA